MTFRAASIIGVLALYVTWTSASFAQTFTFEESPDKLDLKCDGKTWISTVTPKYDAAHSDETYKVYTHIFDFTGVNPITKGAGGKDPHHRGLYIGWNKITANGKLFNLWEMKPGCSQQHVAWREHKVDGKVATQSEDLTWFGDAGEPRKRPVNPCLSWS